MPVDEASRPGGATFLVVVLPPPHGVCLQARGAVDLTSALDFADALELALRATRGHVELDLSGVSSMDATGLHCLITAMCVGDPSHRLDVVGASAAMRRQLTDGALEAIARMDAGESD